MCINVLHVYLMSCINLLHVYLMSCILLKLYLSLQLFSVLPTTAKSRVKTGYGKSISLIYLESPNLCHIGKLLRFYVNANR